MEAVSEVSSSEAVVRIGGLAIGVIWVLWWENVPHSGECLQKTIREASDSLSFAIRRSIDCRHVQEVTVLIDLCANTESRLSIEGTGEADASGFCPGDWGKVLVIGGGWDWSAVAGDSGGRGARGAVQRGSVFG